MSADAMLNGTPLLLTKSAELINRDGSVTGRQRGLLQSELLSNLGELLLMR